MSEPPNDPTVPLSPPPEGVSAADGLAIQNLYARTYWANDSGDVEGWTSSFLEDAVLIHDQDVIEGRAAVRQYVRERVVQRESEPYVNSLHMITNLHLEGSSDVVFSRCYFVQLGRHRETGTWMVRGAGSYEDELRRVDGGWGFVRRTARHGIPLQLHKSE